MNNVFSIDYIGFTPDNIKYFFIELKCGVNNTFNPDQIGTMKNGIPDLNVVNIKNMLDIGNKNNIFDAVADNIRQKYQTIKADLKPRIQHALYRRGIFSLLGV